MNNPSDHDICMNNNDIIPGNYNLATNNNNDSLNINDVYTPEQIIDRFLLDSRPKKYEPIELSTHIVPPPYLSLDDVAVVPNSLVENNVTQAEWDELRRQLLPLCGYESEQMCHRIGFALVIFGGFMFTLFLPFTCGTRNHNCSPILDPSILGKNGEEILLAFAYIFISLFVAGLLLSHCGVGGVHCWKNHNIKKICKSIMLGGGRNLSVRVCQSDPLDENNDTHLHRWIEIHVPSIWHGPAVT